MEGRVKQEIAMLREQHQSLEHGEKFDWVLIPTFQLPSDRFNASHTKLLFRLPSSYPQSGPDNFFVDATLRLKDGSKAPAFNEGSESSSGPAPIPGCWGWFSWHPQAWRPAATIEGGDNLLGFVRGASICLRGEESA